MQLNNEKKAVDLLKTYFQVILSNKNLTLLLNALKLALMLKND